MDNGDIADKCSANVDRTALGALDIMPGAGVADVAGQEVLE